MAFCAMQMQVSLLPTLICITFKIILTLHYCALLIEIVDVIIIKIANNPDTKKIRP